MEKRVRPTQVQLTRWVSICEQIAHEVKRTGDSLSGLKLAAEYAQQDNEFLFMWREQVKTYNEPLKSRALSFLHRLEHRSASWNFEREFCQSFN